jgi:uncharacterized membrane protein YgdD (TMEM256/DUF423 family)
VITREGTRVSQRTGTLRKWACGAAALAGLAGASGVILAATAAHGVADPRLETASNFLLLHAAATLAVCGLALAVPRRGVWFLGAAGLFLCGSLLFGGDLSARALAGTRLFPMAAPIGGTLLILAWVLVMLAALAVLWQSGGGKPDQNIEE